MTPLTPEEARELADTLEIQSRGIARIKEAMRRAATLRAFADQAERLAEYEEAVGEWIEANDAYVKSTVSGGVDSKLFFELTSVETRLRQLQEK